MSKFNNTISQTSYDNQYIFPLHSSNQEAHPPYTSSKHFNRLHYISMYECMHESNLANLKLITKSSCIIEELHIEAIEFEEICKTLRDKVTKLKIDSLYYQYRSVSDISEDVIGIIKEVMPNFVRFETNWEYDELVKEEEFDYFGVLSSLGCSNVIDEIEYRQN